MGQVFAPLLALGRQRTVLGSLAGPVTNISYTGNAICKRAGFTLVEIMVVISILVILACIMTPGFLRSRNAANEVVALANFKTLFKACTLYRINNNVYPNNLSDLATPAADPPYIDSLLASGNRQGYNFVYENKNEEDNFSLRANPTGLWRTLNAKYFYTDKSGIIRGKQGAEAGPDDEIIR